MSRRKRIEAWDTVDIDNYAYNGLFSDEELREYQAQMSAFQRVRHTYPDPSTGKPKSLVNFVKSRLGKQDYTWVGEFRFWVWERGDWRLLANNHKGLCVELRDNLSKEKVKAAWDDLRTQLEKEEE